MSIDSLGYLLVPSSCHEEQKRAETMDRAGPADWGLRRRSSTTGSVGLPASRLLASHQNLSAIRSRIYWTRHLLGPIACRGELWGRDGDFCMRHQRPVAPLARDGRLPRVRFGLLRLRKLCALSAGKRQSRCGALLNSCLLYTSPSPRDRTRSRMPSSA